MKTIGGSKVEPLGPVEGVPDLYWFKVQMSGGDLVNLPLDIRDIVDFVPLAPAPAVSVDDALLL